MRRFFFSLQFCTMFMNAIERVARFTRPVHSIIRLYGGKQLIPGSATMFFVNESGYAVSCKHVVEMIMKADNINKRYRDFRNERNKLSNNADYQESIKKLENSYKYSPESIVQIKNNFVDCVIGLDSFDCWLHPTLDLAIIRFNGYKNICYQDCAKFLRNPDQVKQGKYLCRLGFPFPEFNNFAYNPNTDDIEWTQTGNLSSPRFPIEGMVTRFLGDQSGIYGIEMSTPGLRGQSGGPLFDDKGTVYGMQFSTKHLHLGFDMVDKEIMVNNQVKKISDFSFLHLGQCIHADVIKKFLREKNVPFYEED